MTRTLVVMVKEPRAGRVKTRLAKGIGTARAAYCYRHMAAAVLARVVRPGEWQTVLAIAPDTARSCRAWSSRLPRVAQGPGDLGDRLQRVMAWAPPGPVAIIGTDAPAIRAAHIRSAFAALGDHDAVFGPAPDGGYWLVGLKRFPRIPKAFGGVRWSSAHALADTQANLVGLRSATIAALADIDERTDLAAFGAGYGRRVPAAHNCTQTS